VLCNNVHGNLAQVQIGADARCCSNAGVLQHLPNQHLRKAPSVHPVDFQIGSGIDEYLINGIDVNILRGNEFQIHFIDFSADVHIVLHLRWGNNIVHRPILVLAQQCSITALSCELAVGCAALPLGIHLRHTLHHLKQSCPPGNAIGFQGGRHRKADGLFRPSGIRHHQIGAQRVKLPLHALYRGVKGF